jgi:hypothetical protein
MPLANFDVYSVDGSGKGHPPYLHYLTKELVRRICSWNYSPTLSSTQSDIFWQFGSTRIGIRFANRFKSALDCACGTPVILGSCRASAIYLPS